MKSIILAIALILMPAMAFGQQRHVRVHIGTQVVQPAVVPGHIHVVPHHNHHHRYVCPPRVVYPPIYVHPTPYTLPYWGGYNYYPYGSHFYYQNRGTGIFLQVR
jgi:hypothetical protein